MFKARVITAPAALVAAAAMLACTPSITPAPPDIPALCFSPGAPTVIHLCNPCDLPLPPPDCLYNDPPALSDGWLPRMPE